jgi:twitching motility protein PilT
MSLKAVVTQVLVKTPDGRGRRAILEILVNSRAIAKLITTDQTHQIPSQLQTGKEAGMQIMDQALLDAIRAKQIDADDAIRYASDKKKFQRFITDTEMVQTLDVTGVR